MNRFNENLFWVDTKYVPLIFKNGIDETQFLKTYFNIFFGQDLKWKTTRPNFLLNHSLKLISLIQCHKQSHNKEFNIYPYSFVR